MTLNSLAWSIITPPFQIPDETTNIAYVQSLAERHRPPGLAGALVYSDDEAQWLSALGFDTVVGRPGDRGIISAQQQAVLRQSVSRPRSASNGGGPSNASSQPPLYYALEVVPYYLSPSSSLPDRIALMRVASAFLSGLTVLCIFFILRECFPGAPSVWTSGAIVAGFQPVFGFIGGGVNADVLLFLASALTIWMTLRALRLGLDVETGALIGAALALGVLGKINFVAFLPASAFALLLMVRRSGDRRLALRGLVAAVVIACAPVVTYGLLNTLVWNRPLLAESLQEQVHQVASGGSGVGPISVAEQLSYTWQLYLPRLPFMADQFSYFPPWDSWLPGFIGVFGWLDTRWDEWVYTVGRVGLVCVAALAAGGLWRSRQTLRDRWPAAAFLVLVSLGLAIEMGLFGIRYRRESGYAFEQGRYLLPLLPVYALAVASAAHACGRRWVSAMGAGLGTLAVGVSVFAQLLVVSRFYG